MSGGIAVMPVPGPGSGDGAPRPLSVYPDPAFVSRLIAGLTPDLAASFSERQLFAIQQAFGTWDGQERRSDLRIQFDPCQRSDQPQRLLARPRLVIRTTGTDGIVDVGDMHDSAGIVGCPRIVE